MKNKILLLLLCPLSLAVTSCQSSNNQKFVAGNDLTLTSIEMCDYYGEATLIQYGDYDILIDSGANKDASHINEVLNQKVNDKNIELAIFTHPHGDHIGGVISNALAGFKIETIVDYGYTYQTSEQGTIENSAYVSNYVSWRNKQVSGGTRYYSVLEALKEIPMVTISKEDNCFLKWLKNDYYVDKNDVFPNKNVPTDNPNTTSASCYIEYKYWRIILCGDIDSSFAEMSIVTNHQKLFKENNRIMLKATHHASSSSMGSAFLEWCHPEFIYVSAAMIDEICAPNQVVLGSGSGEQNHPNKSTVKRMVGRTDNVYWTGINGDLTIKIDGVNDAVVSGAGRSKNYLQTDGNEASIENEKNVTLQNYEFYKYFTKR